MFHKSQSFLNRIQLKITTLNSIQLRVVFFIHKSMCYGKKGRSEKGVRAENNTLIEYPFIQRTENYRNKRRTNKQKDTKKKKKKEETRQIA